MLTMNNSDDPCLKHLKELEASTDPALKELILNDDYGECGVWHDGDDCLYHIFGVGVVRLTPEDRKERARRRLHHGSKKRQERLKAAGPKPRAEEIARLRERQGDACVYCGTGLNGKGDVDHIRPLSRGGSNKMKNLQILCTPCNREKGSSLPRAFFRSRLRDKK